MGFKIYYDVICVFVRRENMVDKGRYVFWESFDVIFGVLVYLFFKDEV